MVRPWNMMRQSMMQLHMNWRNIHHNRCCALDCAQNMPIVMGPRLLKSKFCLALHPALFPCNMHSLSLLSIVPSWESLSLSLQTQCCQTLNTHMSQPSCLFFFTPPSFFLLTTPYPQIPIADLGQPSLKTKAFKTQPSLLILTPEGDWQCAGFGRGRGDNWNDPCESPCPGAEWWVPDLAVWSAKRAPETWSLTSLNLCQQVWYHAQNVILYCSYL